MVAKERFLIDENGTRTAVLIDVEYYQKLLDALEEIESIRAYDAAKESGDEIVSFEQAVQEINNQRQ
jgi:PHD/YefM family antitoxin component YafN of YafNO toxin-antitoxin module